MSATVREAKYAKILYLESDKILKSKLYFFRLVQK